MAHSRVEKLRIGVVGCGTIAQVMHLPYLSELSDRFTLEAVCDISATVMEAVADRYRVRKRYSDYLELAEDRDVDAVAVFNKQHTEVALAAARAGKHVFIEKPLCFTLGEASEILGAVQGARVTAMVGYMKQYGSTYQRAALAVGGLKDIRLVRVHNYASLPPLEKTYPIILPDPAYQQAQDAAAKTGRLRQEEAVGTTEDRFVRAYSLLLHLAIHDIALLRGLLGLPRHVISTLVSRGGRYITSTTKYDDMDALCNWEVGGFDFRRTWWDEVLAFYGTEATISIVYENPYLRKSPSAILVKEMSGPGFREYREAGDSEDPFRAEWIHFHDAVVNGVAVRTSVEDAVKDLELAGRIIAAAREQG